MLLRTLNARFLCRKSCLRVFTPQFNLTGGSSPPRAMLEVGRYETMLQIVHLQLKYKHVCDYYSGYLVALRTEEDLCDFRKGSWLSEHGKGLDVAPLI